MLRLGIGSADISSVAHSTQERGWPAEESLQVQPRYLGHDEIIASLEGGTLEIGVLTPPVHLREVAQGRNLRVVAANASETRDVPTRGVLVRPDAPVQAARDLAERVVAVQALGGEDQQALLAWLAGQGVEAERVRFVELPYPAQLAALSDGRVDAIFVGEPYFSIGQRLGARLLATPYAELGAATVLSYYVATEAWLSRHADVARRFARAIHRANAYLQANPAARREALVQHLGLSPELAARVQLATLATRVDPAQLQTWIDLAERFRPRAGGERVSVESAAPAGAVGRLNPQDLLFDTVRRGERAAISGQQVGAPSPTPLPAGEGSEAAGAVLDAQ